MVSPVYFGDGRVRIPQFPFFYSIKKITLENRKEMRGIKKRKDYT
jgi:hypothetical protein